VRPLFGKYYQENVRPKLCEEKPYYHCTMPRENRARGRRDEKKLKRKRGRGEEESSTPKKQKSKDPAEELEFIGLNNNDAHREEGWAEGAVGVIPGGEEEDVGAVERPFYGLLSDEEQEYFRHADELLEVNNFPTPEDRSLFLANVYREAEGKELKLACSQSCSRLMERLILLSSVEQKKKLFGVFSGNFAHLVQHRFASHCCEMLFIQSAGIVTEELTSREEATSEGGVFVSMENLFLYTLNELEGQMTSLLTDRFASHTLRVMLVILAGRPIEITSHPSVLKSKKKEKITITGMDNESTGLAHSIRVVPSSFTYAIEKITTDTIATMDESFIRILAVHPTGNPTLQLLLELELTTKTNSPKPKTLLTTLLPDDPSMPDSQSQIFISGLLYDAIGSRLLETLVTYAPGKLFKSIYRSTFKDRIPSLARNEIASYVVIKVLNRLSKEDLVEALEQIRPHIASLLERNRTVVVKTLLERCHARGADTKALTEAISVAYGSDAQQRVLKMVGIENVESLTAALLPPTYDESEAPTPSIPKPTPAQTHGSYLTQCMLKTPGSPQTLVQESLLALPPNTLHTLALWTPTSHVLQAALVPVMQTANQTFRRKLISALLTPSPQCPSPVLTLASSNSGTHILDSLLASSSSLLSLVERVATTLCTFESELRESFSGRIVWRNWSLDLFKRRRGEWVRKIQGLNLNSEKILDSAEKGKSAETGKKPAETPGRESKGPVQIPRRGTARDGKSAIEMARERFADSKKDRESVKKRTVESKWKRKETAKG
jgi:nucleolar protein 9